MKNNLKKSLLATTILVSSIVGFAACESPSASGNVMATKDVYAMSAVSSIAYLSADVDTGAARVAARQMRAVASDTVASARPSNVADSDVEGIQNCIGMFDEFLVGGGFSQTVTENTSQDPLLANYAYVMNIRLQGAEAYNLYFNELESRTETEVDEGEEEVEITTTFEGVVVYGEETFIVRGVSEVEKEGRETETSLEFYTYKNVGVDSLVADTQNFVKVEQSFEEGEVEYEYTFYENGSRVRSFELEYEQSRRGVEISLEIKSAAGSTEYEIFKGNEGEAFFVEFEKNGKEDRITVNKLAEGGYKFTYSNGFEEVFN